MQRIGWILLWLVLLAPARSRLIWCQSPTCSMTSRSSCRPTRRSCSRPNWPRTASLLRALGDARRLLPLSPSVRIRGARWQCVHVGRAEIPHGKIKTRRILRRSAGLLPRGVRASARDADRIRPRRRSKPRSRIRAARIAACVIRRRPNTCRSRRTIDLLPGWRRRTRRTRSGAGGAGAEKTEEQRLAALLTRGNLLFALGIFFARRYRPRVHAVRAADGADSVEHHRRTRQLRLPALRAFTLSLAYVLGMAVTYATLGVLVGYVRRQHESAGGAAVAARADRLCDRLRIARAVDVRSL